MIDLERDGDVFILTMNAGENRWNTTFVRAFDAALDEVLAGDGPAALVTRSADPKFFSNGLDLAWIQAPGEHPEGGDRDAFGPEFMTLMARIITLPIPTVAAVNGHGFGAGFMCALCHDERFMRTDRGFLCANEVQIGMTIPEPEIALFRHKLSAPTFHRSIMLAQRWGGQAALDAGVVQHLASEEVLREAAVERATALAPLGANRAQMGWMKEKTYGENASINLGHGPAWMLRNPDQFKGHS